MSTGSEPLTGYWSLPERSLPDPKGVEEIRAAHREWARGFFDRNPHAQHVYLPKAMTKEEREEAIKRDREEFGDGACVIHQVRHERKDYA